MRVVYDTSVLATILSRREDILRLKQAVLSGQIRLIISPFILNELEVVLTDKFNLTKQGAKTRTRLLARVAEVAESLKIEKVARDPNDDFILATAVAGDAEYIVTLDKDLLVLKKYKNIIIVTPGEFNELQVQA